jgi:hypothetical protein
VAYYFDTANESASNLLPDGEHRALVDKIEHKPTKSGEADVVTFSVVDGPYHGQKVTKYFNVISSNEMAQKIGRAELKKFLSALSVNEPLQTPDDLVRVALNTTLWITTAQKTGTDGRTNVEIKRFSSGPSGNAPQASLQNHQVPGVPF